MSAVTLPRVVVRLLESVLPGRIAATALTDLEDEVRRRADDACSPARNLLALARDGVARRRVRGRTARAHERIDPDVAP